MSTPRSTPTILVHEWATGGGMAGASGPACWAAEGRAMRRALAREFAAWDGGRARVVATLDARLDDDRGPWTTARIRGDDPERQVLDLARSADFTVVIAPETTGILSGLTRRLEGSGTRLLGSSAEAVALAGDKAALAVRLAARAVDTPPCRVVRPAEGLPADATYPAVLKPIDGAGAVDTYWVECAQALPAAARTMARAILQPAAAGKPMSASFLVDARGRAWPLGIGEQDIAVRGGRFEYRGGRIPATAAVDGRPLREAVESVAGLRGFVGVDFLRDEQRGHTTVLEINPRPTTSVVGLVRLLPPGQLAAAWIGAVDPSRGDPGLLPGLADLVRARPPIVFDANGTILPAEGLR